MAALDYLLRAGLSVKINGDTLRLRPVEHITDAVRQFVRDHKAELLAELKAHKVVVIEAQTVASAGPAWIDRPAPAQQQAVTVEQPDDEPQHFIRTAATATPEWLKARDQYIGHLMACRTCYAPLERHCGEGSDLRQQYDNTPMESTR